MDITINFDEKIRASDDVVSSSTLANISYFYLQQMT